MLGVCTFYAPEKVDWNIMQCFIIIVSCLNKSGNPKYYYWYELSQKKSIESITNSSSKSIGNIRF